MKIFFAASLCIVLATSASADNWVPEECPGAPSKEWAVYEKKVRAAIPSSTIYVPKPFPATEAEILEDLRHQYFRIWKNTKRAEIPKEELPLLEGLDHGTLRFHLETVVNWTPLRCNPKSPKQFYYLVRIYDGRGEEIARFVLNKSGLWSEYQHAPQDANLRARWKQILPTLPSTLSEMKSKYGLQGADAQYVTTVAGTVRCASAQPCVAFKSRGKMYLFDRAEGGGLYEFTPESPGLSTEEIRRRARGGPGATAADVDTKVVGLFSVGNRWVYGRRVPPL
jgi:hypothetical protein